MKPNEIISIFAVIAILYNYFIPFGIKFEFNREVSRKNVSLMGEIKQLSGK